LPLTGAGRGHAAFVERGGAGPTRWYVTHASSLI
jgi:hypothetical protein